MNWWLTNENINAFFLYCSIIIVKQKLNYFNCVYVSNVIYFSLLLNRKIVFKLDMIIQMVNGILEIYIINTIRMKENIILQQIINRNGGLTIFHFSIFNVDIFLNMIRNIIYHLSSRCKKKISKPLSPILQWCRFHIVRFIIQQRKAHFSPLNNFMFCIRSVL